MVAETDPRFSDSEERSAEQRVDEAYERSGFGVGSLVLLAIALGLVLFGAVTWSGHPISSAPTKVAIDQPTNGAPIKPLPQVPNTQ